MSLTNLGIAILQNTVYVAVIIAAILCYIPMKNQRRWSVLTIIVHCAILLAATYILYEYIGRNFERLDGTVMLLPFLAGFFAYYAISTRARLFPCIGVFFSTCALASIAAYGAFIVDAMADPNSFLKAHDCTFGLALIVFFVVVGIPFGLAYYRWGVYLVDNLKGTISWLLIGIISAMVFAVLSVAAPQQYAQFEEPVTRKTFLVIYLLVSVMYILMIIAFPQLASWFLRKEELQEQETIYRMQREQYQRIQAQSENMRIMRHDFKHSIGLLAKLADEGDIDELKKYLKQYQESVPGQQVVQYCDSDLINTILNYYSDKAKAEDIDIKILVDIPKLSESQNFDLISLLGNLLDNAIQGCETLPPDKREIQMKIASVNDGNIYVLTQNSFDGKVRQEGDRYLTTRRRKDGHGIGLKSIEQIVMKYGGEFNAHNDDKTFYVDLNMKIENKTDQ